MTVWVMQENLDGSYGSKHVCVVAVVDSLKKAKEYEKKHPHSWYTEEKVK